MGFLDALSDYILRRCADGGSVKQQSLTSADNKPFDPVVGTWPGGRLMLQSERDAIARGSAELFSQLAAVPMGGAGSAGPVRAGSVRTASKLPPRPVPGGVGGELPMDPASRMARAADLGFTEPVYHSTKADFAAFNGDAKDFGVHVGSAEAANNRVMPDWHERYWRGEMANPAYPGRAEEAQRELDSYYKDSRVMPLLMRPGTTVRLPDMGKWDSETNWISRGAKEAPGRPEDYPGQPYYAPKSYWGGYIPAPGWEAPAGMFEEIMHGAFERPWRGDPKQYPSAAEERQGWMNYLRDVFRKHGVDTVAYNNAIEGGGDSYLVLNPANLRSRTAAAFDPTKSNVNDLLATLAPVGVGLGAAAALPASQDQ